jgi:hypothetical protein
VSEHHILFVPTDAHFIPGPAAQGAGVTLLRNVWPTVREIKSEIWDHVQLHDCGENFESVRCPHCDATLDIDKWTDLLDGDRSPMGGFRLEPVSMPCCGESSTLNDLTYEWPQAFGRFALVATAPGGKVPDEVLARLESALGCRLRVIYRMY